MTRPFFVFLMSNVITPDVVAIVSAIPVQYICESYLLATIADFKKKDYAKGSSIFM